MLMFAIMPIVFFALWVELWKFEAQLTILKNAGLDPDLIKEIAKLLGG